MFNFLVLGQVPGTNITVTFSMWASLAVTIASIVILFRLRKVIVRRLAAVEASTRDEA